MATRQLILSDPLCFIVNKYGKVPLKPLKNTLIDFYSAEDITRAKSQLLTDIESLNLTDKAPHVSARRDGENRQVRETDDIFILITFLDERKLLNSLPLYVTDKPDNMPTLHLFEGDLSYLTSRLDKLDIILASHGSMLATIFSNGQQPLQSQWPTLSAAKGVINKNGRPAVSGSTGGSQGMLTTNNSAAINNTNNTNNYNNNDQLIHNAGTSWSDIVTGVASSVSHLQKQFINNQPVSSDIDTNDEDPFTVYHSTRSNKKRRRRGTPPHTVTTGDTNLSAAKVKRGPLIVGKSTVSGNSGIIAAAQPIKKSVFCIDNVSPTYSVDDVCNFVSNMSVDVISCFEVKPRKRRSDNGDNPVCRKAFRLCINCNDRDQLLEASKWPANVVIYDYFFKSKNQTSVKLNVNTGNTTNTITGSSAGSSSKAPPNSLKPVAEISDSDIIEQVEDHNSDMDATILESYTDESVANCNMVTKQNSNHGAI